MLLVLHVLLVVLVRYSYGYDTQAAATWTTEDPERLNCANSVRCTVPLSSRSIAFTIRSTRNGMDSCYSNVAAATRRARRGRARLLQRREAERPCWRRVGAAAVERAHAMHTRGCCRAAGVELQQPGKQCGPRLRDLVKLLCSGGIACGGLPAGSERLHRVGRRHWGYK